MNLRQAQRRSVDHRASASSPGSAARIALLVGSIRTPVGGTRSCSGQTAATIRENGEGLLARRAPAAPHPDPIVLVVVSLLAPPSVADDRVAAAERTLPRQLRQADPGYPGSALSSIHWQCDKENHGWREGLPLVLPPSSSRRLAFTLLHAPVSNEKKMSASWFEAECAHS